MARAPFDPRQRASNTGPRTNERIRVPEVRVIGPVGEMLGVLETREALRLAKARALDLVEVNPKAVPPVCKIMNFGKYKYEEKKKQNDAKKRQAQVGLKEVKLRPKTDDHDLEVKVRHIRRFIGEGNKVKLTCRFRGREITHPDMAQRQLDAMIKLVEDVAVVEVSSRMEARAMTVIVAPKGGAAARPRVVVVERRPAPELAEPDDDDDDDNEVDGESKDEDSVLAVEESSP